MVDVLASWLDARALLTIILAMVGRRGEFLAVAAVPRVVEVLAVLCDGGVALGVVSPLALRDDATIVATSEGAAGAPRSARRRRDRVDRARPPQTVDAPGARGDLVGTCALCDMDLR